jgi:FdhD protein
LAVLQERQARRRAAVSAREAAGGHAPVAPGVSDDAVLRAAAALPFLQPLNAATRSVHAAAWCTMDGEVALVREDVGRHNALDKLVGALARTARLDEGGFVLMTSRCSYELVAKASFTGARLIACASAPTSMALTWSAALGIPAVTIARADGQSSVVQFPETPVHV